MKKMIAIFICLLSCYSFLTALNTNGRVVLITERLNDDVKIKLSDFSQKMENYFRNAQYTNMDINLDYTITLDLRSQDGTNYTAKFMMVENNYKIQYIDKEIKFYYDPKSMLIFNEFQFHGLTSIFDFFFYRLIGDVADRYKEFGGTPYYEKALNIAREGYMKKMEPRWNIREENVMKILSEEMKAFRKSKVIIQSALIAAEKDDKEVAVNNMLAAIRYIKKSMRHGDQKIIENYLSKMSTTIGNALKKFECDEVFEKLKKIDTQNESYYDELMKQ